MKHLKLFENFIESLPGGNIPSNDYAKAGQETFWQIEDGTLVTLKEVVDFLDNNDIPVVELPTEELKHLLIEVERDPTRVEASNLNFPIIVSKYRNNYDNILDGQHRLVKSMKHGIEKIKCHILDLENCPEKFKKVFIRKNI